MLPRASFAALRRPLMVWLAVCLTLFAALAPTVSHALAKPVGAGGVEICTFNGPRWVAQSTPAQALSAAGVTPVFPADSSDGQGSAVSLEHCPFCLLSLDRVAPAPHALVHLFVVLGESPEPTVEQAFFYDKPLFLGAPPRGPPALS